MTTTPGAVSASPASAPVASEAAAPAPKRAPRVRPQAMTLTSAAVERVRELLAKRGKPSAGIRIGVRTKGCSGLSYTLEFADAPGPMDEKVEQDGVTVLIDPKAAMFIFGTEMDYVEEKLQSGFQFRNPNEKGRCGCGESFHV
jgi:iron-sulfur cluster assembly protein